MGDGVTSKMRTRIAMSVVGAAAVAMALLWGGAPASAAERAGSQVGRTLASAAYEASTVVDWQMNEVTGPTMADSSGNGIDGYIGSSVVTNWPTGDGDRAYHFTGPLKVQNRERLALVDDNPMLDPGTATYSVIVRFRTTYAEPNILQKGQSEDAGGYWKLVIHDGWARCHYRDENYNTKAITMWTGIAADKVNDGLWHVVRCERNTNSVCVYLDEGTPSFLKKCISGSIGRIDNKWPLSIGGKMRCDPLRAVTTCDYFTGDIDWVRIERPSVPFGSG
jgi:hypothetical protein